MWIKNGLKASSCCELLAFGYHDVSRPHPLVCLSHMNDSTKYLIYFVVILLLATGAMWFVGGQKQEYSTEMTIDAPPSRVFRYLSDPELLKKWSSDIVEIEPFEGEQSNVGAMAELVVETEGRQTTMRQQVIKFAQDEMISLQRSNDQLLSTSIFRLIDQGEETNLTYRVKESRVGPSRVTGFFSGGDRQAIIDEEIGKLKQLVESEIDKDLGALPDVLFRLDPVTSNDDEVSETDQGSSEPVEGPTEKNPKKDLNKESVETDNKPVHQNRPDRVFDDQ